MPARLCGRSNEVMFTAGLCKVREQLDACLYCKKRMTGRNTGKVVKTHHNVSPFHSHCCCGVFSSRLKLPSRLVISRCFLNFPSSGIFFLFVSHFIFHPVCSKKKKKKHSRPHLCSCLLKVKKKKRFHLKEKHYILHMPHILYCTGRCTGVKGHVNKNS